MLLETSEKKAAEWFLSMFAPPLARQGKQCFSRGELGTVLLVRDGLSSPIPLRNDAQKPIKTELILREGQWDALCSCERSPCHHGYAAMLALLAHSERPNGDARSNGSATANGVEENAKADPPKSLLEAFSGKAKRAPNPQERAFIKKVEALQQKLGSRQPIEFMDIHGIINIYWQIPNFDSLRDRAHLSPAEFWQEFALFCALKDVRLLLRLDPLTDQESIRLAVEERRRQEEIERWKTAFSEMPRSLTPSALPPADFALMITPPIVEVLVRATPDGPFKKVSRNALQTTLKRIMEGDQAVDPAALPIFNGFFGATEDSSYEPGRFEMEDDAVCWMLGQLFRDPAMHERLLTVEGEPFRRATTPLQWRLKQSRGGDYKLEMVGPEGKPVSGKIFMLPGKQPLYLSGNTIFEGPPKPRDVNVSLHNIPAPALESEEGLTLLNALKVPLPKTLRERAREIPLEVMIRCRIRTFGGDIEHFAIEFLAGSTETGLREFYTPNGWERMARQASHGEALYLYERSALGGVELLPKSIGANWDDCQSVWRTRVTRNFPDKFVQWYAQVPKNFTFELDPELASLARDPIKARVKLECEEVGVDWFDLRTTVSVDDTTLTPEEIQLLLNAKGKPVRLAGKGWRRLEYELTEDEDQSLARLGLSPHDFSSEPQRLHALQLADHAAEKMLAAEQYQRIRDRASEIKTRVTPPLPSTVTATLRPYQTEGFHFLSYLAENNFGGILADDMGLGKTLQTLAWLEWLRPQASEPRPSLVVCPKSVMENWRAEAGKFAPQMKVQYWRGAEASSFAAAARENDLLVLNYSQLRAMAEPLRNIHWHAVILDEAQYIKNPDSQSAQAARALRADHRLALSGTPIENRLLDLWSLMAFAMPGILGNRTDFKRRFDQQNDPFARRRLSARVRPFLLRRTKNQVASELPDRIEEDIICEMEGTQKKLYTAEFKRAQQLLLKVRTQAELNEFRFNFLTSLLRLRQICCHPALVDQAQKKEESAKLSALMDLLEPLMEEGYKVLVFSQFVEMLQMIRSRIQEEKWTHFYLDGSSENRGELVERFQTHEGPAVFLISLKAGGFGLNLTAASYVVLYDPWWNPAVENQAIDRTHRIGQTQKVIAYRLLTENSIEQKIRTLQKKKSALAENVLGDEAFAASLSLDDLRFLFEDPAE